jgi:hypothetical protein
MTEKGSFMRFHHFFLLAPVLFILACAVPREPAVPEWVQHPPDATLTELYGVSVAHTKEEAVVSAAGGIASGVLDAATPLVERETPDKQLQNAIVSEMKNVLKTLNYSKITLKEQAPVGEETAVLVAMKRSDFIAQMKQRVQRQSNALSPAVNAEAGTADFARLGALGSAHETQPLFLADILLLETVDPAADTAAYRTLSKKIEEAYNALKFGMGVTVISDANAIVYVETVKKALRSEGIAPGGKPSGTLLLTADSQQEHAGSGYSVRTRLRIESTVKERKLAQRELYLQARSENGYTDAHRKTAEVLRETLRKEGLFHTLGF